MASSRYAIITLADTRTTPLICNFFSVLFVLWIDPLCSASRSRRRDGLNSTCSFFIPIRDQRRRGCQRNSSRAATCSSAKDNKVKAKTRCRGVFDPRFSFTFLTSLMQDAFIRGIIFIRKSSTCYHVIVSLQKLN